MIHQFDFFSSFCLTLAFVMLIRSLELGASSQYFSALLFTYSLFRATLEIFNPRFFTRKSNNNFETATFKMTHSIGPIGARVFVDLDRVNPSTARC
jgi:hypothetical protein